MQKIIDEVFEACPYNYYCGDNGEPIGHKDLANAIIKVLEGLPFKKSQAPWNWGVMFHYVETSEINKTIEMIKKKGS